MMDAKPNFLISGTAVALIAPEHATVVSRRWKFVMPSTVSLVTSWARTGVAASQRPEIKAATIRKCDFMECLLFGKLHYATNGSDKASLQNSGCASVGIVDAAKSCPPQIRAASTKSTASMRYGFVEASPSRALRDGEGRFSFKLSDQACIAQICVLRRR